jgi:hypothetical protein
MSPKSTMRPVRCGLDRLCQLAHLGVRGIAADHQVVGPVAATLGREVRVARLDSLLHAAVGGGVGEVDQRRRAAPQRRLSHAIRPLRQQLLAVRRHEGVVHVHMRIDAAGHDDLARGVDNPGGIRVRERTRRCNGRGRLALHRDITLRHALRRHHIAATDD